MSVFSVGKEDLGKLNGPNAVYLIRDMIWVDAFASGIDPSSIDISLDVNTADGGIDGEVTGVKNKSKNEVIKAGNTRYQIKSGSFSPSKIDEILCGNDKKLRPKIKSCLEDGGTFIIVFTGWDSPIKENESIKEKFVTKLKAINRKYENANIEVWKQNTIIQLLERFPSLRLKVLGITNASFLLHDEWSKLGSMRSNFYPSPKHEKLIKNFQTELRQKNVLAPIRIIGEPGVGKTKFVLEATSEPDLSYTTIYVENPTMLDNKDFFSHICKPDNTSFVILIVDKCDYQTHKRLWDKLEYNSPMIKLVTIYDWDGFTDYFTDYFQIPKLDDEQIEMILAEYNVPNDRMRELVKLCENLPEIAHMVGKNPERYDEIRKYPGYKYIQNRRIAGKDSLESDEFKDRKKVLLWLSLFKKFGFEPPFDMEARIIAKKIEENHNIHYGDFRKIVNKLKNMKILHGNTTLYITPKIFHVGLWAEWWEEYGVPMMFRPEELVKDLIKQYGQESRLIEWYYDMFRYAVKSPKAGKIVKTLLQAGSPFERYNMLTTQDGAEFFLAVSKADPESALAFLDRFIIKNKNELAKFEVGRRQAVWALERSSMKKDLFLDSARLLLALGEAENESCSNNASGVFANLFSPAPDQVASTEMPPAQRLPVLEETLQSNSKERQLLGIKACNEALWTGPFSRLLIEDDEINSDFRPWKPESNTEVAEYYKSVLDILRSSIKKLNGDVKQEAISVILDSGRRLITIPEVSENIVDAIQELHEVHNVDDEVIIRSITEILSFKKDAISEQLAKRLERLQEQITGDDYSSLMRRYVGMDPNIGITSKNYEDIHKAKMEDLVRQSLDVDLLKPELEWLVTPEAKNGREFGYLLGEADENFELLSTILNAQKNALKDPNAFFLGGYFLALFNRDPAKWESCLDSMMNDSKLYEFVPGAIHGSGMTDRAGERIISLMKKHNLDFIIFHNFIYGGAIEKLSEPVFTKWVEYLLNEKEPEAVIIALELLYRYFVYQAPKQLPIDLTLKLLLHDNIIHGVPVSRPYPVLEYNWKEMALQFVKQHPDRSIAIAETMLENFTDNTLFDRYKPETLDVLDEIARIKPSEVWKIVSRYIEPPMDSRAFRIRKWLRGGGLFGTKSNAFQAIPLEDVFKWVDEDPEKRAAYIAYFIPVDFDIAREVLIRYGEREDVQNNLISNFNTEQWSGSQVIHCEEKKEKFDKLLYKERDPKVRSWLKSYISDIDREVDIAMGHDERIGY